MTKTIGSRSVRSLLVVSVVLGALTACSGGSDDPKATPPPTEASHKDFCAAVLSGNDANPAAQDTVQDAKAYMARLAKAGTPTNITAEGREGFETLIAAINALPDDADPDRLSSMEKVLGDSDDKDAALGKVVAFYQYMGTECRDELAGVMGSQ